MNTLRLVVISVLMATATLSAQPNAAAGLAHVQNSFTVSVGASYAETATLFSPLGERVWAGETWNPQFLFPTPASDVLGAVFTVRHGGHKSVWVNSLRDVEARHFQYVYFIADAMVTVIDVRFRPIGEKQTGVDVTYTRTALDPEANGHVEELGRHDREMGPEWQRSIEKYMKERSAK